MKNIAIRLFYFFFTQKQLLENCSQEEKKDLESGVEMLLKDMGERYKFLALFPSNYRNMFADDPPAGFA